MPSTKNVALSAQLLEQPEQLRGLSRQCRARLLPAGDAQPAADELVPILEVDAEKER